MNKIKVKEVKRWMKSLEENRYKKIVEADVRRITWFINNKLSEIGMPDRLSKKWEHTQYGREKYLAQKYIDEILSKEQQITESALRTAIRREVKRTLRKK